ncbi:alpha-(1,3)-fucosyltransferase 7-like [Clupea harengus]|uniref:Fucosyltransferase n=1 Tax=Clupea harengus TaxID=7950 RepID=A0A6P3WER9_CLUHA|nr:alpha-(1,3)-fucosyltransferase 7-like [Clupea harengus]
MRFPSHRRILLIILVCLILFGYQLVQWLPLLNSDQTITNDETGTKTHKILVWHWPFGNSFNLDGDYCKDKFGVPNCIMMDNQSRLSEADIVIFHNRELIHGQQRLPVNLKRPEKQRWVWMTMESPENNGDLKPFNGYFNWTMTYHQDADIYSPYGFMVPKESETYEPLESFIPKDKFYLACWVVSSVSPHLERTTIYKKLKTVIPIKVFGRAVFKSLHDQALLHTMSRCYFYLAFENSVSRDYITEKLWRNAYMSGAVPVVFGPYREEYEAVAQTDSFIHVNDFDTVEELGKFLMTLAYEDRERYASYFNWRRKYTVEIKHWVELACKFCPKISSMPPHKVYEDLDAWP